LGSVNRPSHQRDLLVALLAALEDPARAAELPAHDPALTVVARHHRLTPLLSITCSSFLPTPLADLFRQDRVVTAARNMVFEQVGEECIRTLRAAGIPTILLKGLDYATRLYHGQAGARPTADVDLLVPNESRRAAFRVLDRLGFEPRACAPGFDEPDYHEVAWRRSGVEVDLHMALVPFVRCRIDYPEIWSEARPSRIGETETLVLAPPHAAIFQSLHMGVDHFAVPAIYLVDLARLLPEPTALANAQAIATKWRCRAPFITAVGLAAAFLPGWHAAATLARLPLRSRKVIDSYGPTRPLSRPEQLLRKLVHFDSLTGMLGYVAVQSRRTLRERVDLRIRQQTVRQRLSL